MQSREGVMEKAGFEKNLKVTNKCQGESRIRKNFSRSPRSSGGKADFGKILQGQQEASGGKADFGKILQCQ
jgi:hypothetical protein